MMERLGQWIAGTSPAACVSVVAYWWTDYAVFIPLPSVWAVAASAFIFVAVKTEGVE